MNILISGISRSTAPSGICRYADMLSRALSQREDVRTTLVIGRWQEAYFREIFKSDVHSSLEIVDIENSPIARNRWALTTLPRVAHRTKADVVHLAHPIPIVRRLFPSVIAMTVHDFYPFDVPRNFRLPVVNRIILRLALQQSHAIVTISESTRRRLKTLAPAIDRKRIVERIYNPIAIPQLQPAQFPVNGLAPFRFILAVAQHRRNKNLDLLQKSFAMLRLTGQVPGDFPLVIVGSEGPESASLHALRDELNLTHRIQYASHVRESELAWLYSNCSVLVVPSSCEGLCMPVVEGLSLGARVVCSDIPVLREIGEDHCVYFPLHTNSEIALADAIVAAMSSRQRPNLTLRQFSIGFASSKFYQLYQRMLSGAFQTTHVRRKSEVDPTINVDSVINSEIEEHP